MSGKKKDLLFSFSMGTAVAVAVFLLNMSRGYGLTRCLCDGAFVAAVFLLGVGGIRLARNRGTFDVAGFGLRRVIDITIPALRRDEKEDMQQYRERKALERRSSRSMLLAGVVFLALSVLFLVIYELLGA